VKDWQPTYLTKLQKEEKKNLDYNFQFWGCSKFSERCFDEMHQRILISLAHMNDIKFLYQNSVKLR
jgi:hypothetical protein